MLCDWSNGRCLIRILPVAIVAACSNMCHVRSHAYSCYYAKNAAHKNKRRITIGQYNDIKEFVGLLILKHDTIFTHRPMQYVTC